MNMLDSKEIRSIRESLGWSRAQLAAHCDVTEYAVRLWENGTRHPRWDSMVKINSLKLNGSAAVKVG